MLSSRRHRHEHLFARACLTWGLPDTAAFVGEHPRGSSHSWGRPPQHQHSPPDPQDGGCPGYPRTTGLFWIVPCGAPPPSCPRPDCKLLVLGRQLQAARHAAISGERSHLVTLPQLWPHKVFMGPHSSLLEDRETLRRDTQPTLTAG